MGRTLMAVALAAAALVLTGCGPSAEETAAVEAADTRACEVARDAFDGAQALLDDGKDQDDFAPTAAYADDIAAAADVAGSEELRDVLEDAAAGLHDWVDSAMQLDGNGNIPAYVDNPMADLDAACASDE